MPKSGYPISSAKYHRKPELRELREENKELQRRLDVYVMPTQEALRQLHDRIAELERQIGD